MKTYSSPFYAHTYNDEDVEHVECQRRYHGVMYQLIHPLTGKGMLEEGDCFYCDDHSDENLMCVSSLSKYVNNSLFSICKHCFDLHTFITFNHGNDKIINCKEN
mgnify:FL=1